MNVSSKTNRRGFLKQSGKSAVGAAAGLTILPSSRSAFARNDQINLAVVGFRGRGRRLIREFLEIEGVNLVALCDVDETLWKTRCEEVEEKQGRSPKLCWDFRELLDDPGIDAIATATPNHWHALLTIRACQAEKDVYVEKPACWCFEEGERMIEAARKYDRVVQVGHGGRARPANREAVRRAWGGEVGDVYMSRGLCFKARESIGFKPETEPPSTLHWDLWQGPVPRRPFHENLVHYNWHWFWDYGNGDIGNQGVHQIDIARWLLGKGLPVSVHCTGGRYGYQDQGETPNTLVATFHYEDGKMLVFEVRGLPSNEELGAKVGNIVYGSDGFMSSGDDYQPRIGYDGEAKPMAPPKPVAIGGADDESIFQNFINVMRTRNRKDLVCELKEGVISAQLCHLANISYRLGRSLRFDPNKKQFVDDPEANALMTRKEWAKGFELPKKV